VREAGGEVQIYQVRVEAELGQDDGPQLGWGDVLWQVADERQVVLIAEQNERARTTQRVGVGEVEACAGERLQIAARRVPGVGRMDRRL
jgi:hypothetical protein